MMRLELQSTIEEHLWSAVVATVLAEGYGRERDYHMACQEANRVIVEYRKWELHAHYDPDGMSPWTCLSLSERSKTVVQRAGCKTVCDVELALQRQWILQQVGCGVKTEAEIKAAVIDWRKSHPSPSYEQPIPDAGPTDADLRGEVEHERA